MIAIDNVSPPVGVDYLPPEPAEATPARQPYQPFPVDVLPPTLRRYVVEQAAAIGCDPAYVALPLLAALAAAVGNSRVLGLKRSWREVIVLWCVVIGDSGTMKSPAFDAALYFTRRRENTAAKKYEADVAVYLEAKAEHDEALKQRKKAKPAERGERPEPPAVPSCARYVTADATNEALAPILLNNRRGLLLARDELAGWLGGFNQYKAGKGSDVPNTLEMHRAGTMTTDRKTGDMTTIRVPRASLCIAGGIQPKTLARSLTPDFFDNGLAARLLLAMPPKRRKRWTEADVDEATIDAMQKVFDGLFDLQPDTDADGDPAPAVVVLDDLAKEDWIAFYERHAIEQHAMDGELSAAWSKLEGYAARLALVMHCVRQAEGESVRPLIMDANSIAAGVRLADWFGDEARRVYALLGESEEERAQHELVDLIRRKGSSMNARSLQRARPKVFKTADAADKALVALANAGVGRWHNPPHTGPGRPAPRELHLIDGSTSDGIGANAGEMKDSVNRQTVGGRPHTDAA